MWRWRVLVLLRINFHRTLRCKTKKKTTAPNSSAKNKTSRLSRNLEATTSKKINTRIT